MTILFAYLSFGLAVGGILIAFLHFGGAHSTNLLDPIDLIASSIIATGTAVAWPVLVGYLSWIWISSRIGNKPSEHFVAEDVFEVVGEHLIEELSLTEIGMRELVDDPLGGAPRLPFGHLNDVWTRMLGCMTPESSVWSFSAKWTRSWGRVVSVEGYAVVTAGVIGPHILTRNR